MRLIDDVGDIFCRLVGENLEGGGLLFFLRLSRPSPLFLLLLSLLLLLLFLLFSFFKMGIFSS